MADVLYPNGTLTQGTSNPLDFLNPANWFQEKPDTSAYAQPSTSGADSNQMWNTGWNAGFNSGGSPVNNSDVNYGSGFNAGWQEYLNRNKSSGTGGTPTGGITTITGDPNAGQQQAPSGPSPQELALRGARSSFDNAYNPVFQQLDEWAGLLPQQQTNKMNTLNNLYGSQQTELSGNMSGSLGALDTSRGQVAASKAQSIRDLQQQMNQMSKAGGMQLGSAGAGDSSASRMYNFALSKAAGQSSADVSNQANSQYGQIQGQEQQIRATYDDQVNKLTTWKAEQTGAIQDWADGQLSQIRSAKATATGQKAAALAATEVGLIQNAVQRIQQIDDQISQWNQGIQQWALGRMATLDDAKTKISGFGQYTPQAITTNELQGLNNVQGANSGGMTGFYDNSKKKEQDFLNNYR